MLETLSPGGLYIRLIAHPVPDRFTYTYHSDAIPREDKEIPAGVFTTSCEQDRLLENVVTCHLSTNQTLEEGEYKLAVGNQMGSSDYLFWVSGEGFRNSFLHSFLQQLEKRDVMYFFEEQNSYRQGFG